LSYSDSIIYIDLQSVNSKNSKTTNSIIKHKGYVKKVNSNSLTVSIITQSACASCHAKGACTLADVKEKEIEVTGYQSDYKIGDQVTIRFKQSNGFTALLWGYVAPFILVLSTLIIAIELTNDELIAGLLSLAVLVPYYIILYFFRHHLKKVLNFKLEETN